jgi:hypothetical protein
MPAEKQAKINCKEVPRKACEKYKYKYKYKWFHAKSLDSVLDDILCHTG